jgi:hypothetical protein
MQCAQRGREPQLILLSGGLSALGHKRTLEVARVMSALPAKADIVEPNRHVRFVPKADTRTAAIAPCTALRQASIFRSGVRGNNPGVTSLVEAVSEQDIAAPARYLAGS